jgi:PKD repeat protein
MVVYDFLDGTLDPWVSISGSSLVMNPNDSDFTHNVLKIIGTGQLQTQVLEIPHPADVNTYSMLFRYDWVLYNLTLRIKPWSAGPNWTDDGYYAEIKYEPGGWHDPLFSIYKLKNGTATLLTSYRLTVGSRPESTPHIIKFDRDIDGVMKIYWDNVVVCTATDTENFAYSHMLISKYTYNNDPVYVDSISNEDLVPVPLFTANVVSGEAPLTVLFNDQSIRSPTSWSWNFGDPGGPYPNTSTLQNPTHSYNHPGLYTVTLTVTNIVGSATITKTDYIVVLMVPLVFKDVDGYPLNKLVFEDVYRGHESKIQTITIENPNTQDVGVRLSLIEATPPMGIVRDTINSTFIKEENEDYFTQDIINAVIPSLSSLDFYLKYSPPNMAAVGEKALALKIEGADFAGVRYHEIISLTGDIEGDINNLTLLLQIPYTPGYMKPDQSDLRFELDDGTELSFEKRVIGEDPDLVNDYVFQYANFIVDLPLLPAYPAVTNINILTLRQDITPTHTTHPPTLSTQFLTGDIYDIHPFETVIGPVYHARIGGAGYLDFSANLYYNDPDRIASTDINFSVGTLEYSYAFNNKLPGYMVCGLFEDDWRVNGYELKVDKGETTCNLIFYRWDNGVSTVLGTMPWEPNIGNLTLLKITRNEFGRIKVWFKDGGGKASRDVPLFNIVDNTYTNFNKLFFALHNNAGQEYKTMGLIVGDIYISQFVLNHVTTLDRNWKVYTIPIFAGVLFKKGYMPGLDLQEEFIVTIGGHRV